MKKELLCMAAMAVVVASCSDDVVNDPSSKYNTIITASSDEPQTRTAIDQIKYSDGRTGILWTPDDAIGVFGSKSNNVKFENLSTVTAGRVKFGGNLAAGDNPVYVYYPYSPDAGTNASALRGELPLEQTYDAANGRIAGDYKIGHPRAGVDNEYDFSHIFALFGITVDAKGLDALSADRLRSVTIAAPEGRVLGGAFTFSAIDGKWTLDGGADASTITLDFTAQPSLAGGVRHTGYLSCAPTIREGDELTITVTTNRHTATFTRRAAYDFEPDAIYNFDLSLALYDPTIEELPLEPEFKAFAFDVANNAGKILDKKVSSTVGNGSIAVTETAVVSEPLTIDVDNHTVSGMIPYLYDFNLVPTFTVDEGVKVEVNGVEQTSGKTAVDFTKPVTYTLTSAKGIKAEYTVTVTNTGLPVLVLEQSTTISGYGATWDRWFGDISLRSKSSKWAKDDYITLYDVNGKYTMDRQAAGVRKRGNSSQNYPKKPLAIKLVNKAAIGDMPKHKRWVLLSNWMDASLIRNAAAFAVAHATERAWQNGAIETGLTWNPHGINVEFVINGRHVGNYYLCEQIKIDANRLNIKDSYEDVVKDGLVEANFANCGYLIESDDNYDENYKFMTSKRNLPFMLKDDATKDILNSLKTKIQGIEDNLTKGNYAAAYADYDIYSAIDQWIIHEVTMNKEFKHPKSVFTYMDGGEAKLCHGPVWDFDWMTFPNPAKINTMNSTYNGMDTPSDMNAWLYGNSSLASAGLSVPADYDTPYMWYPLLFRDPDFRAAVQERWKVIYPYLQGVAAEIAEMGRTNAASWKVNIAMWPLYFNRKGLFANCFNGDEDLTNYNDVVQNLIDMYTQRLEWMNTAITTGNFVTNAK